MFKIIVLIIAGIILITVLTGMSLAFKNANSDVQFPPVHSNCPDYWVEEEDSETKKNMCINKKNLGKPSCSKKMDFSVFPYGGSDDVCQKQMWAKGCRITWDGVTNNKEACDNDKV